jgi:proline iminopeptidase
LHDSKVTQCKVEIPARQATPKTNLFVKIIKQNQSPHWDRDVIIMLPGGPGGNHTLYTEIEEELLADADLVIVDPRGCGYSDKSNAAYCTLTDNIEDIEALRKALKIHNPIILGCSYGSFVALGCAINYPEKLSKLVLISSAASHAFIDKAKKNLEILGSKEQKEIAKYLWSGTFRDSEHFNQFRITMASLYMRTAATQPMPSQSSIPFFVELVNFAFNGYLKEFDYSADLIKIKVPTIILSGQNDWMTEPSLSQELHEGISSSKLVIIDECGHFPWKDQQEQFLKSVRQFLKKR